MSEDLSPNNAADSAKSYIEELLASAYDQQKIDQELEQIKLRFVQEDKRIMRFIIALVVMLVITLAVFIAGYYFPLGR